jgi:hypothetical protein
MTSIVIKLPKSGSQTLMLAVRAFIGIFIIVIVDLVWDSMRDRCKKENNRTLFSWMQLLFSWIVLAIIIAMQVPTNMRHALIYASFIGLLTSAIGTLSDDPSKGVGTYIGDILQSLTATVAAGAGIYWVSKAFKLYPKGK